MPDVFAQRRGRTLPGLVGGLLMIVLLALFVGLAVWAFIGGSPAGLAALLFAAFPASSSGRR